MSCVLADQAFTADLTKRLQRALAAGFGLGQDATECRMRSQRIEMAAAGQRGRGIVAVVDRSLQVLEAALMRADLALQPSFQEDGFRVVLDPQCAETFELGVHVR